MSLSLRLLGLGGQTVKHLFRVACRSDLDQSERKSSQVEPSFQLASTRKSVWPGLKATTTFISAITQYEHKAVSMTLSLTITFVTPSGTGSNTLR